MLLVWELLKNHWKKFAVLFLLIGSFIAGYTARTPKDSETSKTSDKSTTNNDITTTVTTNKDGTTTTVTVDKSKTVSDKKTTDTKVSSERPNYAASTWVETPVSLQIQPTYRIELERRLIGGLWGGASVNSDKKVGLGLRFEW